MENRDLNQRKKALDLINEAVTLLTGSPANSSSSRTPEVSSSNASNANTGTVVQSTPPSGSSRNEISKLFPAMFRERPSLSLKSKRWVPYKPRESWTHTFVVLSSRNQNWVPSREEKGKLTSAGLGEKKITFSDVQKVLEKEYPKLVSLSGGFELMRSGGSRRNLELIPIPAFGYSVPILKEALGQAICYVRPLQMDLDMSLTYQVLSKQFVKEIDPSAKEKIEELLVKHGLTDVPLSDINREKAVQDLLVAEVLVTRTLALHSFFNGLNSLGLGNLLRNYPIIVKHIFPSKEETLVDVEMVKSKLHEAKLSCSSASDEAEQSWKWFLQFIDEALTLNDTTTLTSLVLFTTGSTVVDTGAKWEVAFQQSQMKTLLEADSCFNRVTLPIGHKTYEEFKKGCYSSLENGSIGYGRF